MQMKRRHYGLRRLRWVRRGMLLLVCGGLICGSAYAQNAAAAARPAAAGGREVLDLSWAWRMALEHDHEYRAAISEQASSQTERAQGRAGLLPQVHAGYHRSRVVGRVTQPSLGQDETSSLDYDSLNAYVQVQQPLLNYTRYASYRRGHARADMGKAIFRARHEAAGLRLANTYFNALLAHDKYVLQRSLTDSLRSQSTAIETLYRQQEATRIDVQETAARLAVARADLIDARDQWTVALRELEALLGEAPTHMAALRDDIPLLPLVPSTLEEWLQAAHTRNADVQVARHAVSVAGTEVDVASSRYMPTTDLVATYGRARSEDLSSLSQRTNTFSVGIQVNIPIFAGGYNRANVARARSDRMRLQYELNATVERTLAEVTRQYTNVRAGADLIGALRAAEASGELSLHAARRGFTVGVSSNLEVLKVQDRLYQTRYQLAKAQLDYVLARLKLAVVAGTLDGATFDQLNDTYLSRIVTLTDGLPGAVARGARPVK